LTVHYLSVYLSQGGNLDNTKNKILNPMFLKKDRIRITKNRSVTSRPLQTG